MKKGKTISVSSKSLKLGDELEKYLKPSAEFMEKYTGVSLKDCESCQSLKEALGTDNPRKETTVV